MHKRIYRCDFIFCVYLNFSPEEGVELRRLVNNNDILQSDYKIGERNSGIDIESSTTMPGYFEAAATRRVYVFGYIIV